MNATPKLQRSESNTEAKTPVVEALISVQSRDVATKHEQTFQAVCQQYIEEDGWTEEQQRVLGEIFTKFMHNVFATVRKNLTTSALAGSDSSRLTEPLNRQLVEDVEALDAELDSVSARVEALRQEVPALLNQLLKKQHGIAVTVKPQVEATEQQQAQVASVLSHVAQEIETLSADFNDVKKDIDTAVTDCTSTLKVVEDTLNKPDSATQQVRHCTDHA